MESDDAVVLGVECVTFEYESLGGNLAKTDWVKKIEDGDIDASDLINQFSSYFFSKFRGEPLKNLYLFPHQHLLICRFYS